MDDEQINDYVLYDGHVNDSRKLSIYDRDGFINDIGFLFKSKRVKIKVFERFYKLSDGLRGYYFKIIIPEIQKAYRYNGELYDKSKVDYILRDRYLFYEEFDDEIGLYIKYHHTLSKENTSVSGKMMKEFCHQCIIFAALNLNWNIPYINEFMEYKDISDIQRLTLNK